MSIDMVRLAIVDQRQIDVPFNFAASCGVLLAFNGEIYNWRSLRAELSDGKPWETDCDAEVVARAWRKWGASMLDKLNGMWGIALVDTERGEVFLARDRAGEKPLYYVHQGTALAFASEIKALPVVLRETGCQDADVFEFDCLKATPFLGVYRLGPGQYIHLRGAQDIASPTCRTWWTLPESIDDSLGFDRAVDETEALLVDAIRLRVPEGVGFGVQVSGGLDSAIVQAVTKSDRCYTVSFPDDGVDCLPLARIAAGREPVPITFSLDDLIGKLPLIAYHLDTPATWTSVCQWFMDARAAADGCKVILCGEGADELYGGYSRYRLLYWLDRAGADVHLSAYGDVRRRLHGTDDEILARLLDRSRGASDRAHALSIVRRYSGEGSLCERAMRIDFATTMQVLLRMGDTMAAAHSMENRSPFFDHRLMEHAATMPTRWKINESGSKIVLCEVASRLGVPSQIVEQTTKRGLFVPWSKWTGSPGWDRSSFAETAREAWRKAFFAGARLTLAPSP